MATALLPWLPKIVFANLAKIRIANIPRVLLHLFNYFLYRTRHLSMDSIINDTICQYLFTKIVKSVVYQAVVSGSTALEQGNVADQLH